MSRRMTSSAMAAAVGALLMTPAIAHALPTLTVDKPCYIGSGGGSEPIKVTGAGFTPGSRVTVKGVNSTAFPMADAAGNLVADLNAPLLLSDDPAERDFMITATEDAIPAQTVTITSRVTKFNVDITPKSAKPTSKVTIKARGFTAGKNVYAHYLYKKKFNSAPKFMKTIKLGPVVGPCGTMTRKVRQIPLSKVPFGFYPVQIDVFPKYKAKQIPYARFEINVRRIFGAT